MCGRTRGMCGRTACVCGRTSALCGRTDAGSAFILFFLLFPSFSHFPHLPHSYPHSNPPLCALLHPHSSSKITQILTKITPFSLKITHKSFYTTNSSQFDPNFTHSLSYSWWPKIGGFVWSWNCLLKIGLSCFFYGIITNPCFNFANYIINLHELQICMSMNSVVLIL